MSCGVPPIDHFPSTHRTWLETQVDEGLDAQRAGDSAAHTAALRAIGAHVMNRYRLPLIAYVRGSRWRTFGDAEDLVAGFFARRLGSLEYFDRWRGVRVALRRWLMNGMILELRGMARDQRRESARESGGDASAAASELDGSHDEHDQRAERLFDRAWARGLLQVAAERTAQELEGEGKESSWRIFERHLLDEVQLAIVAKEVGVAVSEARAMCRLSAYRLKRALRALLCEEGTPEVDVDHAVKDVYAAALGD